LRDEDELRGRVKAVQAPLRPGQMGGVLDSLTLVLTSSLGLASWVILMFGTTTVVLAYSLYRLSRR
jgi:hypothetical protein